MVAGREILRHPRHLIGEVVGRDDLVHGLIRGRINLFLFLQVLFPLLKFLRPLLEFLLTLTELLNSVGALSGVVDDSLGAPPVPSHKPASRDGAHHRGAHPETSRGGS